MKLRQAANDVMLRINDVALRANGTEHLSHIGATILPPNTKALDFGRAFRVFGAKNIFLSPLHLFPDLMDLNLRLQPQVEKIKPLIYCINERCVL